MNGHINPDRWARSGKEVRKCLFFVEKKSIVFKQDKEELPEVGEAGSIYSTKEGVFVYVNGDYQQLGTSNDFNWEPIKK